MFDHQLDADQLIELVDLKDKRDAQFKTLSAVLKQRVGLAVALVNDQLLFSWTSLPPVLDPRARRDVWFVIERLKKQGKRLLQPTIWMKQSTWPIRLDHRPRTDNRVGTPDSW